MEFYDIDLNYIKYLKGFCDKVPNITYDSVNKFMCGIVLKVNDINYYAPISSKTTKQRTSLLIKDDNGDVLSSIKFSFMIPAPSEVLTKKDFAEIAKTDKHYADLLQKEYIFCRKNEKTIKTKAETVYKIGCDDTHKLHKVCCDFKKLEGAMLLYSK